MQHLSATMTSGIILNGGKDKLMEVEWGVEAKNSAGKISFQMQDLSKIDYLIRREISVSASLSSILLIYDRSADFRFRNILASNWLGLGHLGHRKIPFLFLHSQLICHLVSILIGWTVEIEYGDIKVLDEILEERERKNRLCSLDEVHV
jgi:hypothetical protein